MIPRLVACRLSQACLIRPCGSRGVLQPVLQRHIKTTSSTLHHCEEQGGKTSVAGYVLFRQHNREEDSLPSEDVHVDKTSVAHYVLSTRQVMVEELAEDCSAEASSPAASSAAAGSSSQEDDKSSSQPAAQTPPEEKATQENIDVIQEENNGVFHEENIDVFQEEPVEAEKSLHFEEIEMGLTEDLILEETYVDLEEDEDPHHHDSSSSGGGDPLVDIDDVISGNMPPPSSSEVGTHHESASIDDMLLSSTEMDEADEMDDEEEEEEEEYYYDQDDDDIRTQVLSVALENVPTYGWTTQSIAMAVDALELSPTSTELFKRGGLDLLFFFTEQANKALTEHLIRQAEIVKLDSEEARGRFIENAIKIRLQMITPYMDSWPQALQLLASPAAVQDVAQNGTEMMDEIFYHSGDLSTDMSWYTKRAVLGAIYTSTELFMLNDKSPEFRDTWAFLHRRMNDARSLKDLKDSLDNAATDTFKLISAGFTTAQNILGVGSRKR